MDTSANFSPTADEINSAVILIIDNSGSMGEPAASKSYEEARGYTRNDFSRQGAKLCVNGALDGMYMGVIKFNSYASVVHDPVEIGTLSRQRLLDSIDHIQPTGGTQIFPAIQEAMRMIDRMKDMYGITKVHVTLFTDGNDGALKQENVCLYFSSLRRDSVIPFTLDTVGFGPSANTELLVRMASLYRGTYALCFDASMVGTIFGRAIARSYLGSEAFGIHESDDDKSDEYYSFQWEYHQFRGQLYSLLLAPYGMLSERVDAVNKFNTKLEDWIQSTQPTEEMTPDWYELIGGLHADLNDQIRLAVSDPYYWTCWGKSYWQMMGIALEKENAPTFKDKCLQIFGSPRAKAEYERISQIYDEMPMVVPSNTYELETRIAPIALTSSIFNSADSGCFHQKVCVLLSTGQYVGFEKVEQMIRQGKRVIFQSTNRANPTFVELETLIKIDTRGKKTQFCRIGNLVLTPTHPVFFKDRWFHPKAITQVHEEYVDYVYNLILKPGTTGKRGQSLIVDGYECVGLGHGITYEDDSVAHDTFWGSEAVIDSIKLLYPDQYNSGLVNFTHQFKRNELTGWVCEIESSIKV